MSMPMKAGKVITPTLAHIDIPDKGITLTYGCSLAVKPHPNTIQFLGCLGGSSLRVTPDEHQRGRKAAAKEMTRARIE